VEALRVLSSWGSHIYRHLAHRWQQFVSPMRQPLFFFLPAWRFLVLISVRGWVDFRAIVGLEGLGKLKKSKSSRTRTCDLPVRSIVPQPTTLPCICIHLSVMFPIHNFWKQGNSLLTLVFNFVLEYAIRNIQETQVGLKLIGTHQILVYDDDVNLFGVTQIP
jgi:hypothetical protein